VRYLDLNGLTLEGDPLLYAEAIDLEYDSTEIPDTWEPGDVLVTGPWQHKSWSWLPRWVTVEVLPDGTKLEQVDPLTAALKTRNLPISYRKKAPGPKSKNYHAYLEAVAEAEGNAEKHVVSITVADPDAPPYHVVTDPTEAVQVINSLRGRTFAYDYETTGLNPETARIVGVALADEHSSWYLARNALNALPELTSLLTDRTGQPLAHNAKYEYKIGATNLGLDPTDATPVRDTMVMHWVLNCGGPNTYDNGLKAVTRRLLNRNVLEFEDVVPNFKKYLGQNGYGSAIEEVQSTDAGLDLVARYAAAGDARNTFDLHQLLRERLRDTNLWHIYEEIEMPLTPVLAEMELAGLLIDQKRCEALYIELIQEEQQLEQNIRAAGFKGNIGSGEQVATWLYKDLELPILATTATGRGKIDATTLDKIRDRHPIIPVLSRYFKVTKLKNTFLTPLLTSGVTLLHPSINQTSTGTGRLSSSNPNAQNWPLKVRDIVVPPEGQVIWGRDYSQIEPRVAAVASGDPAMLHAYRNNLDPYKDLGFDMGFDREKVETKDPATRKIIKGAFLGWMYGARGPKLVETVAKQDVRITIQEANHYIRKLEEGRPVFVQWRNRVIQQARQTGASFSLYGRRRLIPKIFSKDPTYRAEAEREAVNMVPQGTSADIIKRAMPSVLRLVKQAGGVLRNQVHDEIVGTWSPQAEAELGREVDKIMEDSQLIPLKVEAESGPTWFQAKPH
jgi:DNA polymerase I-like protein with 3'-5' exonuclease and polymerase domains